ncbi:hypothetical protein YB2330_000426 [Saitoella coloradoensis]
MVVATIVPYLVSRPDPALRNLSTGDWDRIKSRCVEHVKGVSDQPDVLRHDWPLLVPRNVQSENIPSVRGYRRVMEHSLKDWITETLQEVRQARLHSINMNTYLYEMPVVGEPSPSPVPDLDVQADLPDAAEILAGTAGQNQPPPPPPDTPPPPPDTPPPPPPPPGTSPSPGAGSI